MLSSYLSISHLSPRIRRRDNFSWSMMRGEFRRHLYQNTQALFDWLIVGWCLSRKHPQNPRVSPNYIISIISFFDHHSPHSPFPHFPDNSTCSDARYRLPATLATSPTFRWGIFPLSLSQNYLTSLLSN